MLGIFLAMESPVLLGVFKPVKISSNAEDLQASEDPCGSGFYPRWARRSCPAKPIRTPHRRSTALHREPT